MASPSPLFLVISKWKGALRPIYYDQFETSNEQQGPKSLLNLSCQAVINYYRYNRNVLDCEIPAELYPPLLAAALNAGYAGSDRAVSVLVKNWKYETLPLRTVMRPRHLRMDYDSSLHLGWLREAIRNASGIMEVMLDCMIKYGYFNHLRVIDLRDIPTVDLMVGQMCRRIINHYTSQELQVPLPKKSKMFKSFGNTRGIVVIKLDCAIKDNSTVKELCKVLQMNESAATFSASSPAASASDQQSVVVHAKPRIEVEVCRLDASCLGENNVLMLLRLIKPQTLTGLGLQYNSLENRGFANVLDKLANFTLLSSLDVSCNNINLFNNDAMATRVGAVLSRLPNLVRLDVSNNRLSGQVAAVLEPIVQGLEYLKISATRLAACDMAYLSRCRHTRSIKELDVSEQNLTAHFDSVLQLLEAIGPKIEILELEECSFRDIHLGKVCSTVLRMRNLKFLNLTKNKFVRESVVRHLPELGRLPQLEALRLSYPTDVDNDDDDDEEAEDPLPAAILDEMKSSVKTEFQSAVATVKRLHGATRDMSVLWIDKNLWMF